MSDSCLFCNREGLEVIFENELCFALRDINPVTKLHTLIIRKEHFPTAFEIPDNILVSLIELAKECRIEIEKIPHVHFHLIPRRKGDVSLSPAFHEV